MHRKPKPRNLDHWLDRRYTRKPLSRADSVTICVAAIANPGPLIVAASDRMLTVGGIYQVTSGLAKYWSLTPRIVALVAGDMSFQREIFYALLEEMKGGKPPDDRQVLEIVNLYLKHYNAACQRRAEQAILRRVGLTFPTFHNGRRLPASLALDVRNRLNSFVCPEVETLILGRDATGHHIYRAIGGDVSAKTGADMPQSVSGLGTRIPSLRSGATIRRGK